MLIERPERWNQGCSSRDIKGYPCSSESESADKFSILGALERLAAESGNYQSVESASRILGGILARRLGHILPQSERGQRAAIDLISAFNEIATHQSVLQLLDSSMVEPS
jgi:hypothetical protein